MNGKPTARSLEGKAVADAIQARIARRAEAFRKITGRAPGLSVVLVGDDPASHVYVGKKESAAAATGLRGGSVRLAADTPHDVVVETVKRLNADDAVDAILVQLPLPSQVHTDEVLACVDPDKDVDGFHPVNVGRLHMGLPSCRPCTPAGVIEALHHHEVPISGRHAVVVGRSNIVGKPMAALLLEANATVTTCHSRTKDITATCRMGDILVVAVGRPGCIGGDAIKPGATVIDVGVNRLSAPKDDELATRLLGDGTDRHRRYIEKKTALVGDVDWLQAREVAGLLTPVPGGVGPLTIAMLLSNTVDAACRRLGVDLTNAAG